MREKTDPGTDSCFPAETAKDGSLLGYVLFSWNSLPVYHMRKIGPYTKEKVYFRKSTDKPFPQGQAEAQE